MAEEKEDEAPKAKAKTRAQTRMHDRRHQPLHTRHIPSTSLDPIGLPRISFGLHVTAEAAAAFESLKGDVTSASHFTFLFTLFFFPLTQRLLQHLSMYRLLRSELHSRHHQAFWPILSSLPERLRRRSKAME